MAKNQRVKGSLAARKIVPLVTRFAAMSDGNFIEPLNSFKKHEKRLTKYQRRMSRKVKFSKNWHKAT